MFKIKNNTFHVTRGDRGSFNISFDNYEFQAGDTIELNIYNEDGLNQAPLKTKTLEVTEASENVTMELLGADTQIGGPVNERTTYWYEIVLNGDRTPLCYDEQGPKIFYIYPGGLD